LTPSTNVAVIQPLPGVGDMIWHQPHIRAIAAHIGRPVTLVAKPRSAAAQIFAAEPTVRDFIWMDRNPEGRHGRHDGFAGLLRLVMALRAGRFDAVFLLHQSQTLALATWLAGVPARYGYGAPGQRKWLNQPAFLKPDQLRLHWFEQATNWLATAQIPMAETGPRLPVLPEATATVCQRLGTADDPPVTIGIGSSAEHRQWGAERFVELIRLLRRSGWNRFVLLGGPPQTQLAAEIVRRLGTDSGEIILSLDWPLTEVAALLAGSAFYVGNDTGFLNMAGAVGLRSYGLYGASDPFRYLSQIVPINPSGGAPSRTDGMARISAEAVLAAIVADQDGRSGAARFAPAV
jgi:heptosyltransferase II